MNYISIKEPLVITLLYFVLIHASGQIDNKIKHAYKSFDNYIGISNSGILNGTQYTKKYNSVKNENEFYGVDEFVEANLKFTDQLFFGILIKYDLFEDEIIVKIPIDKNFYTYKLNKHLLEEFSFNNKVFVFIDSFNIKSGFYEKLFKNESIIKFYKKNKKNKISVIIKNKKYDKFKSNNSYYIMYDNLIKEIFSKQSIVNMIPKLKKEINLFYKSNKKLKRKNYDIFLTKLNLHLSSLLTSSKN